MDVKRRGNWFGTAARFLLGVAAVAFLLKTAEADVASLLDPRTIAGVGAATGLLLAALMLSALRWQLVMGDPNVRFLSLCRLYVVGWFFSLFLPTSVGGDVMRATAVARSRVGVGVALSSIFLERLVGVAALAFYLALGLLVAPQVFAEVVSWSHLQLPTPTVLGVIALVFFICVAMVAKLRERILQRSAVREAISLLTGLWQEPRRAIAAVFVSVLVQGVYIAAWLVLARAFLLPVPALAFLVFVPFISLAAMLPLTIGGLGVREGAWVLILGAYSVDSGIAVVFSLSYFLASLLLGAFGGVLFATSGLSIADDRAVAVATQRGWQESLEREAAIR